MSTGKMTAQSVCAGIIAYHPSSWMLENISQVLSQVQGLVVVDNGFRVEELDPLRAKQQSLGFQVIENGENRGIAEALNQRVQWAKSQGYPWVILFDQDSRITDGFVVQMFAAWESHPDRERVGSVHPRYADPETGIEAPVPRASDGSPVLPMTSGALTPVWIFDRIGWFASEYFIDLVDREYCFRIRAAGFVVADSRHARLLHAAGHPARTTILGRTFHPSHHSAIRRYYLSRNFIAFYREYLFYFLD
jgi:rhamnosyltransferase